MKASLQLLTAWNDDLSAERSIAAIMKLTGKRSKPGVFLALRRLVAARLLAVRKEANIGLYRLELDNPLLYHGLQCLDSQTTFPQLDLLLELVREIPQKAYCLIVFGSYAAGTQRKGSDLDLCFLVPDEQTGKRIAAHVDAAALRHPINIDDHYFTFNDFHEMLVNGEENLGKQIYRSHRILFNADIYYRITSEAHRHGFRP